MDAVNIPINNEEEKKPAFKYYTNITETMAGQYLASCRVIEQGEIIVEEEPLFQFPIKNVESGELGSFNIVKEQLLGENCGMEVEAFRLQQEDPDSWKNVLEIVLGTRLSLLAAREVDKKAEEEKAEAEAKPTTEAGAKTSAEAGEKPKAEAGAKPKAEAGTKSKQEETIEMKEEPKAEPQPGPSTSTKTSAKPKPPPNIAGVDDPPMTQLAKAFIKVGFFVPANKKEFPENLCQIYKTASYFTHGCNANCIWTIAVFPDKKIRLRVRAAVKIYEGTLLTINRVGRGIIMRGTFWRQQIYFKRFTRFCRCELCFKPNELRTYQSGMICETCVVKCALYRQDRNPFNFGYLIQLFPAFDYNPDTMDKDDIAKWDWEKLGRDKDREIWSCDRCKETKLGQNLFPRLDHIVRKIEEVDLALQGWELTPEQLDLQKKKLDWIWRDECCDWLHPQHWMAQYVLSIYPIPPKGQRTSLSAEEQVAYKARARKGERYAKPTIPTKDRHDPVLLPDEEPEVEELAPLDETIERLSYIVKLMNRTCPGIQPARVKFCRKLAVYIVEKYKDELDPLSFHMEDEKKKTQTLIEKERRQLRMHLNLAIDCLNETYVFWKGQVGQDVTRKKMLVIVDELLREARSLLGQNERQVALLTRGKFSTLFANSSQIGSLAIRLGRSVLFGSMGNLPFLGRPNRKAIEEGSSQPK